jgi:hypothetical protein
METKPTVRRCPICRLAMVSSKSRDGLDRADTFNCLNCGTEIIETPREPRTKDHKNEPKER